MKVVILAGGLPSTLIEADEKIPKPMAEIGEKPILWHIMKQYSEYGYNDFIICAGYKIEMIKDYFMNYYVYQSDITVNLQSNEVIIHKKKTEDWNVTVVDTGISSSIPERLKMIREYLEYEPFIVCYGDCVSNINVKEMVKFHNDSGKVATYSLAKPIGRSEVFPVDKEGRFIQKDDSIIENKAWVNACNMVFEQEIYKYLENGKYLEQDVFEELLRDNQVVPYIHDGFWSPMETIRDKTLLEKMWNSGQAVWKVWRD